MKTERLEFPKDLKKLMRDDSSPVSNLMNKLHKHDFAKKKVGRHDKKIKEDVLFKKDG